MRRGTVAAQPRRPLRGHGAGRAAQALATAAIGSFVAGTIGTLLLAAFAPAISRFAVTLGVGIVTTVFTAFTLTRLIVAWWVRWVRPRQLAIS